MTWSDFRRATPVLVLALVVVFSVVAARLTWVAGANRDRARFENAIASAQDRLESRVQVYVDTLRAGAAFLSSSPQTTSAELAEFFRRLAIHDRYPGVQGLGFAEHIDRSRLAERVAEIRAHGDPDFDVWPKDPRDEYSAIVMLEPLDRRNLAAIGYDMSTEPVRREAMDRARDTGAPAMSGRVLLVQEIDDHKQTGFLIYVPVYRAARPPDTVEERRRELRGFVYAPFRAGDFLQGIFGREREPRVALTIFDGEGSEAGQRLARIETPVAARLEPRFAATRTISIAGRPWTLAFSSSVWFDAGGGRAISWLIGLGGSGIGVLLFSLARAQERSRREAERVAEDRAGLLGRERAARSTAEILNRIGQSLAAELDSEKLFQLITDESTAIVGAEFGAFFRNAVGEDGGVYLLHNLSGAMRDRFSHLPPPRNTEMFAATFSGAGVVRRDDVRTDPRFGRNPPYHGLPPDHLPVVSYLAVPVLSASREVFGGLFFGHSQPARFTEEHERLVVGIAAQASIALDNARLYEAATEADRRKDEFLAMLAHELRNPLAPIVTSLQMLRRGVDAQVQARAQGIIERQVQRMVRLVDDLLDVSRITRGKIQLQRRTVDLRRLAEQAAEATDALMRSRNHRFRLDLPAEPVPVDADPVRIEQVLTNLVDNAAKYTEPGGEVHVAVRREGGSALAEVRDNGIGIPRPLLPQMFDLFAQADRTLDRAAGGLGIGLTIVQRLVELHGGAVTAHSDGPGTGSTFVVRLPLGSERELVEAPREAAPSARASRRLRVLVVDDQPDITGTLCELLRTLGHDCRSAGTGPAALEIAREFLPQLVLLDLGLPGMSGYEVAQRIRRQPDLAGIRIVAISGYAQESDRERARRAGFDEHFAKPVDLERFERLLQEVASAAGDADAT